MLITLTILTACATQSPIHPFSQHHSHITRTLTCTPIHKWVLVDSISLDFNTYHPQGLLKIGNEFYISSVQIDKRPRYTRNGKNIAVQDEGSGKGHLFRFDIRGNLLQDIELKEGSIFHPGGMDFDGRYIWIPITKYYPYSQSLLVRLDIQTHQIEKVGYIDDSIGALIYNPDEHLLVGANWDADEFLTWQLDDQLQMIHPDLPAIERRTPNTSKHLAIQDSKYLGNHTFIGFGLKTTEKGHIGGFDIIDTQTLKPIYSIDIEHRTPRHQIPMTSNPSTLEVIGDKLRLYFAPEDNHTTMYIYETKLLK